MIPEAERRALTTKPPATVAPIATDFQHGKVRGDLTEGDDAAGLAFYAPGRATVAVFSVPASPSWRRWTGTLHCRHREAHRTV